jgi:hypothetical protein
VFDDVPERLHCPTMSGIRWFVSRSVKITEVSVDGERYENDAGAIARTGKFFTICGFHIEMPTLCRDAYPALPGSHSKCCR